MNLASILDHILGGLQGKEEMVLLLFSLVKKENSNFMQDLY